MYSTASTQMFGKQKGKTSQDTDKEESFSFEVEAQREYVHRLKAQREKIEALYSKYDYLLEDMRKKDDRIKDQERRIGELTTKCKEYSLLMPELDLLRKQNAQLLSDNEHTRYNLAGIEESYILAMNEYKSKSTLNEREREKIQEFNEQLMSKLRMLQQKMEDRYIAHEREKKEWQDRVELIQKEMAELKDRHVGEISVMNASLLQREEEIDILQKENQKLREGLMSWEQGSVYAAQVNEDKIEKIHQDYKTKIKSIKQEIDQHAYNNELLTNKISVLNLQIQKLHQETGILRDKLAQQKIKSQQTLYQAKLLSNQQKSILREQSMQLESKLIKVDKQLQDSLRREKDLIANLRRLEESQQVKKSLREVERRELEKINRLLLLEK